VVFEKEGQFASSMTFTVPQPFQSATTAGAAPKPGLAPQSAAPTGPTPAPAPRPAPSSASPRP